MGKKIAPKNDFQETILLIKNLFIQKKNYETYNRGEELELIAR